MPRLLLVDDNPSIHRIAESLLASSDVELVCVDSAAEALDRIERGEHFDVALVDTVMPGMDGWTLLGRLRTMEATARMPIALMAGVLDPVDPVKLAQAPVQGFLKKPIELRELSERVKTLLASPVVAPASSGSAFTTVPGTPVNELLRRTISPLPEFRPEFVQAPSIRPQAEVELEADLLVLTEEDLWPEEPVGMLPGAGSFSQAVPDMHLEFEGLDLDSLQDLAPPPLPRPDWAAAEASFVPAPRFDPVAASMDFEAEDAFASLSGLEELDALPARSSLHPAPVMNLASERAFEPKPAPMDAPPVPERGAPDAGGQDSAVPSQSSLSYDQARALIQMLMADPVLLDALVKTLAARMGDQVLREVAWEVIPDLAGRLQR